VQPVFQINAFATGPFTGNPALVCPLEAWPEDAAMQRIAAENNLTTAFFVGRAGRYRLRWFAPKHGEGEDTGITGSAHSSLAPYWAARLNRTKLRGR
jgi:predicted PhzF superfamily epimerase YddE/YHI9